MTLYDDQMIVSELPSGNAPETGCLRVAEYAYRYKSPCETYACPNRRRCKEQALACTAFRAFISFKHQSKVRRPTEPSREIFDAIYNDTDEDV